MKYVKIKADNYNEAMMKLKMEYGDDTIPISHKYIKEGGLFKSKFFAKDIVELTAAIQDKRPKPVVKDTKKSIVDFTVNDSEEVKNIINSGILNNIEKNKSDLSSNRRMASPSGELKQDMTRINMPEKNIFMPENRNADERINISKDEYVSLKKLGKEFHEIKEKLDLFIQKSGKDNNSSSVFEENRFISHYMDILKKNDFDQEECITIIDEVKNSISNEDLKDQYKIEKTLKDLLKNKIFVDGAIKKKNKKEVIMFIGPTGVGKTTTIAKLGAIFALRENCRVAFVTIDNYRIAATEQLKKYAEIMKIPLYVVNDNESFKEIINKENADIIMVDTSGRGHRNDEKIAEIKSFAESVEHDFIKILCVSANTKKIDLVDIFKAFDKIKFDSVIITKVDETSYIGNVIDIADKYRKPISYYTFGQEVPNDISAAESDKILNMLIDGTGVCS